MAKEINTWPLWLCIPRESLARLILYQWKRYKTKLDIMIDPYSEIESLAEIDRIIRWPPDNPKRVV